MKKPLTSKKSNIVSASFINNQFKRENIQAQEKRKKEGRKNGIFDFSNIFIDKFNLLKWDLIFCLSFLANVLWVQDLHFLAIVVFLQIYITSYLIFDNRKYRLPLILMSLSIIPFYYYFKYPNLGLVFDNNPFFTYNFIRFRDFLLFLGWNFIIYGVFWFIIIFKNIKQYEKAKEKELCLVCNQLKDDFIIHMGRYLCRDCFLQQSYAIIEYNGIEIYQSNYRILSYFEQIIGEKIPIYNLSDDNDILKPEFKNKLFFSVEEKNIIAISIPNKNFKINLPEEIGLLHTLRILNFPGNQISKLPYSFRKLYHLKILNLKNNHLDFLPGHSLKSLTFLKRRGCYIMK